MTDTGIPVSTEPFTDRLLKLITCSELRVVDWGT
jgi:hypothetical protein